jgi:hypothetical protein
LTLRETTVTWYVGGLLVEEAGTAVCCARVHELSTRRESRPRTFI